MTEIEHKLLEIHLLLGQTTMDKIDIDVKLKLAKKVKEAIEVIQCCKSDSELLLGFLDKLERIDALKHAEDWQKKTYVASYLKAK